MTFASGIVINSINVVKTETETETNTDFVDTSHQTITLKMTIDTLNGAYSFHFYSPSPE